MTNEIFLINKIALAHWDISDPCQNKILCFENDAKQFLSAENMFNS